MRKNETRAWMELYKLGMQAFIGLVLAILLQGLIGKLYEVELSFIVVACLILVYVFFSIRYIWLSKQLNDAEEGK